MKYCTQIFLFLLFAPSVLMAQQTSVSISGTIKSKASGDALPFASIVIRSTDSSFVTGTVSNDEGLFTLAHVAPGDYFLTTTYQGYGAHTSSLFVGSNSTHLNIGTIFLEENMMLLNKTVVNKKRDAVGGSLEKKTYSVDDNMSQSGGSVLQSMNNLPGVTTQDGKVQLRGNDQVVVLIDGKQTAITGFGDQNGLDNLPASAVEKIEIINNPSAKYDANGNAGIINIILKKEEQRGINGKVGLSSGLGALWIRRENLPGIRPQYHTTPKVNPSLSLNYRRKKVNLFLQANNLYTQTLNKNEFVTRTYDNGVVIDQQLKRNRNTNFFTSKAGLDWYMNDRNTLTASGLYSRESVQDRGDQPFFNGNTSESLRLWQFLEDEVVTATMASVSYNHKFKHPGHKLNVSFNYTFDREDEKYFFSNTLPLTSVNESFALVADQRVADLMADYVKPLKHGRLETGLKFRSRSIPTNMQFHPSSLYSVLDTGADGKATYRETIPAVYGNYAYEVKKLEAEVGLRLEYVDLKYDVAPGHNTYQSDGYSYFQPFPNVRLSYKIRDRKKLSLFYNRRVDRPDEGDIRIFPKYDDAEIIKVGNPGLQPQFTNSLELGYKNSLAKGYIYGAAYYRSSVATITRIATTVDTSTLIYNISQNAGRSYNTGIEMVLNRKFSKRIDINLNLNGYFNQIDTFTVTNLYPVKQSLTVEKQQIYSGNIKLNLNIHYSKTLKAQLTAIYLAPDIIPQGTISSRVSVNLGITKSVQKGNGEFFLNATDIMNSMIIKKEINGDHFTYTSSDYYETQVVRLGYNYKFKRTAKK